MRSYSVAVNNPVSPRQVERGSIDPRRIGPIQTMGRQTPLERRGAVPAQLRPPEPGLVYWGTREIPTNMPNRASTGRGVVQQDRFEPVSDSKNRYALLSNAEWNKLSSTMDGVYGAGKWEKSWVRGLWEESVQIAEYALRSEGLRMTPFDAFDILLSREGGRDGRSGGGGGGGGGPNVFEETQRAVDLSNPTEARGFLENSMFSFLGRAPTGNEYKTFLSALNAAQEAEPNVTTSRSVRNVGGATMRTSSDVRRTGGVDRQQFATEFARAQEGAAETAVSTVAVNAFLDLLR
jgi:hypothetical protein